MTGSSAEPTSGPPDAELDDPPIAGLPRRRGPIEPLSLPVVAEPLRSALLPRVRRLGYLGAFFAFAARQPRALHGFHVFTEELKSAVSPDVTDVVALAVAARLGNDYERVQHERLARRRGRPDTWVRAAVTGEPTGDLSAAEAAARALAVAVLADAGHGVAPQLAALARLVGQDAAVAVLLLVGRYVAHAHVANALSLTAPVD